MFTSTVINVRLSEITASHYKIYVKVKRSQILIRKITLVPWNYKKLAELPVPSTHPPPPLPPPPFSTSIYLEFTVWNRSRVVVSRYANIDS